MGRPKRDIFKRFWSKVLIDASGADACWEWQGSLMTSGYGQFHYEGKPEGAHRVVWILERGPIPSGLHVLHRCDNPKCVNPDHLFLGTPQENHADCDEKGRRVKGEAHYRAKLSPETAMEVYESSESDREIAHRLGISKGTVWAIRTRKTWKHLHKA